MFAFVELTPQRLTRKKSFMTELYAVVNRKPVYKIITNKKYIAEESDAQSMLSERFGGRILLPQGISAPPQIRRTMGGKTAYLREILSLSAARLVSAAFGRAGYIGIVDPFGRFARYLHCFLPVAAKLSVVSLRQDIYAPLLEEIYHTTGAALLLNNDVAGVDACDAVIVAEPGLNQRISHPPVIAAYGEQNDWIGLGVVDTCIAVPEGISPLDFAFALTAFNGVPAAPASRFVYNGREIGQQAAVELMTIKRV